MMAGICIWGLWQRPVRITRVTIIDTGTSTAQSDAALADLVKDALIGSYAGIIPHDSIFFFPAARMYSAVRAAYPELAAVSIARSGLTGISVKVSERVPIARWCGASIDTDTLWDVKRPTPIVGRLTSHASGTTTNSDVSSEPDLYLNCYFFDANGFIFAVADSQDSASSTPPVNSFFVFEPLATSTGENASSTGENPIGATLPNAESLPAAFDFARRVHTLGSSVITVALHDGEMDDYLASGTRLTYLLGDERNAFTALTSASGGLNLADGSLEYVDLRFDGKVYVKKRP